MRIVITELPQDKFRLEDLVDNELLLRLLRGKDVRQFVHVVNSLKMEEQIQISQEITRLPVKLEQRVTAMLLNAFDTALEQPVSNEKDIVLFIRALKRLLVVCLDSSFESDDRLLALAEFHPSMQVMSEAVEVLVSRVKSKAQFNAKLTSILRDIVRANQGIQTEKPTAKRFGLLGEENQLRLNLFCKIHLYLLNPSKYPIREEQLRPYFIMLRTKPYLWLLNLLQSIKSEQMSFIYRDILDAKISLTPTFHFQTSDRYIHPELVNAEAMEIAVDKEKPIFVTIAHSPDSIVQQPQSIYFKFNMLIYRMYEQCISIGDNAEILPANEQIQTQFNNMVGFLLQIVKAFACKKEFVTMTTDGEKRNTEYEKLSLLDINLRALDEMIQRYNLSASSKIIAEKDLLTLTLSLVENLLQSKCASKFVWDIFRRTLSLYMILITVASSNLNVIAASEFPELVVRIIDTYELPRHEGTLNQIFEFTASFLEPMLQKANRGLQKTSPTFTRRMLDAYFQSECSPRSMDLGMFQENALEHYLKKEKSPHAKATFNEFIIEKLKILETPEHSVETLMANPKKRSKVVLQINKLLRVLDSTVIKLQPETSRLLTFRLMEYFILFEDQVRDENLAKVKKKLEFQQTKAIYQQALTKVITLLEKDPFGHMSMECLLRQFGNELYDDWTTVLQIFRNLHIVIFLNVFREGDYSEACFQKTFKITKMLCKCKSQIQQRLSKQLKQEGVKQIDQLQLLASIKGLETTYGLLYSFFRRLKQGLALLKVHNSTIQSVINLDQKINMINGLKEMFPILTEDVSKHQLILYIDSFSDILHGCGPDNQQVLSLHYILNLYTTFRDPLFKTLNTLNGLVKDKTKIHNTEFLKLKTLDDYIEYFKKTPEKFDDDIETKFAQNVNKLLRLFILRTVATQWPFRYNGVDYADSSANKMGLGMYLDQFDQLVKNLTMSNLELYSKCIRFFLQPNFYDNLLLNNDRRVSRHNNRAAREAVEQLLRMGVHLQIARMAISQVEEPQPELALEWINNHRDDIETLERAHFNRGIQQSNRNRLSQQPIPGVIQEIDPQNLPQKMKGLLKQLIKDILRPNMYSEYSDLIQNMFIEAIDRFEKDESRLSNYSQLSKLIIKDLLGNLTRTGDQLQSFSENHISIQLNLLKSIVNKCQNKKQVRIIYLSDTPFLAQLLGLIDLITRTGELSELREKIIEAGLTIVCLLMPNKKKEGIDRSNQITTILSVVFRVTTLLHNIKNETRKKYIEDLIIQAINKAMQSRSPQISAVSVDILIKLISEDNIPASASEIIEAVLSEDEKFIEANMESEIKAYFFQKRSDNNLISVPKRNFLTALQKYNLNPRFYAVCKTLIRKKYEKPIQGKKQANIIYNQSLHKFSDSEILQKPFIDCLPSDSIRKVVSSLLFNMFSSGNVWPAHIKIVHQLLHKFPLLTSYVLNFPIGETILLDKLINNATENEIQMSTIMFFLCLNCPLVVQWEGKEALLSSYIQSRVITKFYKMLDKEILTKKDCRLMLLLTNLLQLKEVNKRVNFYLNKSTTNSLGSLLEKALVKNCAKKQLVYIAEPLSLILKQAILESLKTKYKLYEEIRDGSIEEQMIPLQIIISEATNERRELMEELQRTGQELENDEENGQMLIAALERRLMNRYTQMFRRRVSDRSNIEFIPIEEEENKSFEPKKEGEQQPAQISEQMIIVEHSLKNVEREVLPNNELLNINYDYSTSVKNSNQPTSISKDFSVLVEGESQYQTKPNKPISYDNQKNQSLRNRINILASGLRERKPTETMEIEQLKSEVPQQPQLLEEEGNEGGRLGGRRISVPLDVLLGRRDRTLAQLLPQRLGLGRGVRGGHIELLQDELVSDRSDGQVGARRIVLRRFLGDPGERARERDLMQMEPFVRATRQNLDSRAERERPPLQENEIQKILEEEIEPPKPPTEEKKKEEIKPVEKPSVDPILIAPIVESQPISIVPPVVHQHIVVPPSANEPINPPADEQSKEPINNAPKQAERMCVEQPISPIHKAVEPKKEQRIEEQKPAQLQKLSQENKIQVQIPVQTSQEQQQQLPIPTEPQNHPRLHSDVVEQQHLQQSLSPRSVVLPNQIEPEVHHRPILEMLGLPQSFLRDNGLDEQLFDSLPETIQMEEILLPMMSQGQQDRRPRPPAANNEDHKEELPEIDQEYLQGLPEDQRRMLLESMQPRNLVSENLALLSEIEDPALRESILIEATPEQLASFPQEIQAEAEMLRTRRLRQIAADFDEDDHMAEAERSRTKRPRRPLVYPDIEASLFSPISQEAAKACLNILYWSFPKNYKPLIVQSLLQNKLMQPKVIITLLYILRNPLQNAHFPSEISYFNDEKVIDKDIKSPLSIIRGNIIGILLDFFTNSPYKDNKLMKEKISYKGLNGIQLKPLVEYSQTEDSYQPYIELLDYALDHSTQLSAYLLDGVTDIPESTMRKLVKKLYSSSLDDSFISNLKGLSDNPQMAKIFEEEVTETHHPKISIYAHLLKYKFAQTKYLHKLHLKALASYKSEYNQFLNQIYRIYTLQDLKNFKQLGQYKSIHRNVIKAVLARKSRLSEQPIYLIMSLPFLMDFETKKQIFHNQIKALNEQRFMGKLEIKVNRKDIFRKSFNQIMARTGQELRARLCVIYDDEGAYDAGGLTRDWFLSISKEMFNRDYALFETSSSGNTYQPSSKSHINPDHLKFFKFVGRVVGKALSERENVDAFFTRSFYKLILGQELVLSDLQEQDYELHRSMQYYRNNPVTDEFNFTYISHKFGVDEVKQLIPGGKNIWVNQQNKEEWIRKMAEAKMKDQIQPQIKAFLQGFHELIPADSIRFFDAKELELLISGLPNIDLDDLKNNIQYSSYTTSDNIIKWFWEILETYDQAHLAQVIQFITGTSKIPAQGFKALKGMHGPQKISIVKSYEKNRLPQAHTCYNQLELPDYPTKAVLEKNMEVLFKWGNEGFGFM